MPNVNNGVVAVEELKKFCCENCGGEYETVDGACIVDGETWCEQCEMEDSFSCDQCSERFHNDNMVTVGDDYLCESCFSRHCSSCGTCGDNYYDNDGASCGCDDERYGGDSSGSDFSSRNITHVLGNRVHTFGVEIEAEGGNASEMIKQLPKSCGVHHDGSLENGAEVVTPPLTMAGIEDYIPVICKALNSAGYNATDNCGLHVHCKPACNVGKVVRNGKIMKAEEKRAEVIAMVVRVMSVVEPVLFAMLPVGRLSGRWCQELKKNNNLLSAVVSERGKDVRSVYAFSNYVNDRYYGTNLCALQKYGTIEFRYHSGTVDTEKIIAWVRILNAIVSWCEECVTDKLRGGVGRRYYNRKMDMLRAIDVAITVRSKLSGFFAMIGADSEMKKYILSRIAKFKNGHKERGRGRGWRGVEIVNSGSNAICDRVSETMTFDSNVSEVRFCNTIPRRAFNSGWESIEMNGRSYGIHVLYSLEDNKVLGVVSRERNSRDRLVAMEFRVRVNEGSGREEVVWVRDSGREMDIVN